MWNSLRTGFSKLRGGTPTLRSLSLQENLGAEPAPGSASITGLTPLVVLSSPVINVGVGSISALGKQPRSGQSWSIPVAAGTITSAGAVPDATPDTPIAVPAGSISTGGFVPEVSDDITIPVGTGSIAATGLKPNIPSDGTYEPSFVSEYADDVMDGSVTLTWRNLDDDDVGLLPGFFKNGGTGLMKVTAVDGVLAAGISVNDTFARLAYGDANGLFKKMYDNSTSSHKLLINWPAGSYAVGSVDLNLNFPRNIKIKGTLATIAHPWKYTSEGSQIEYTRIHNSGGEVCRVSDGAATDSVLMFENIAIGAIEAERSGSSKGLRLIHSTGGRIYCNNVLLENQSGNAGNNDKTHDARRNKVWRFWMCVNRHGGKLGGGLEHDLYIKGSHLLDIQRSLFYDPGGPGGTHCVKSYNENMMLRNNVIINKLDDGVDHDDYTDWGSVPIDGGSLQDAIITNNTIAGRTREKTAIVTPSLQALVQNARREGGEMGGDGLKRPFYFTADAYVDGGIVPHVAHWEAAPSPFYFDVRTDDFTTFGNWDFVCPLTASGTFVINPKNPGVDGHRFPDSKVPNSAPWNNASYWHIRIALDNGTVHDTTATWDGDKFTLDLALSDTVPNNHPGVAWPDARGKDTRILNPEFHNPLDADYYWDKLDGVWTTWDTADYYAQHFSNNTIVRISSQNDKVIHKHSGSSPTVSHGEASQIVNKDAAMPPQWNSLVSWAEPPGAGAYDEGHINNGELTLGSAPTGFGGMFDSAYVECSIPVWCNNPELALAGPLGLGTIGPNGRYEELTTGNTVEYTSRIYEIDAEGQLRHQGESPVHQVSRTTTLSGIHLAGERTVTLVSAAGVVAGDIIHIRCNNDPWDMSTNYWFHRTTVTVVDGTEITIQTALEFDADNGADVITMTPQSLPGYFMTELDDLPTLQAGIS